ncbi:transcriptional regulator MerR family [Candidatus Termititenax aidoneus]|uniref:Transcriptional regulator MerR family n=1 Tax=Termititenax aidoneus TaxID=2218524 RepID=A0A388T9B5_TERA1|nr:transcriptional regulator MerR family [Candidatus Termititenax aidoneus]
MSNENYLAPGGKEYTLTAGQLAGLNKNAKILDIACGHGAASLNLVKKFGCQATAVDIEESFIKAGQAAAVREKINSRIRFIAGDFNKQKFAANSFDMIIAEGGALSYIGRDSGLKRARFLLKKNGYIEISDLILRGKRLSREAKDIFLSGLNDLDLETEESYRTLLKVNGFEIVFCSYIARQYWEMYYENIKQNLKNRKGFFSAKNIRASLNKEMSFFYKRKDLDQIGYLFIVAKKR